MIKTRLLKLLFHAKKYIVYQVIWKWIALLGQVVIVLVISMLLENAFQNTITGDRILFYGILALGAVMLKFLCDRQAAYMSYKASVDVKRILRKKIYGKLLKLGAAYRESAATSEVVQMAAEGV